MKILYVFQNYRKSYTGLGETFLRELKKTNHSILTFEFTDLSANRYLRRIYSVTGVRLYFFKQQNKRLVKETIEAQPDLIVIFKGSDLFEETLHNLRISLPKTIISVFNPDDPFNPASCGENIRRAIPYYDHYFIWTHRLIEKIKNVGAKNVHYLPFAWDQERIHKIDQRYQYDVGFIGNYDKERGRWVYGLADEVNKKDSAFQISVFGDGWKPYKGVQIYPQANGKRYLTTVSATRINLNILRLQNKGGVNMRTFEIPGIGAFMMHERSDEASAFFSEDKEAAYFSSITDLHNKILYYLKHQEEREQISTLAHKKMREQDFTYGRIIEMLLKKSMHCYE